MGRWVIKETQNNIENNEIQERWFAQWVESRRKRNTGKKAEQELNKSETVFDGS